MTKVLCQHSCKSGVMLKWRQANEIFPLVSFGCETQISGHVFSNTLTTRFLLISTLSHVLCIFTDFPYKNPAPHISHIYSAITNFNEQVCLEKLTPAEVVKNISVPHGFLVDSFPWQCHYFSAQCSFIQPPSMLQNPNN